jgi:hypothetical protein
VLGVRALRYPHPARDRLHDGVGGLLIAGWGVAEEQAQRWCSVTLGSAAQPKRLMDHSTPTLLFPHLSNRPQRNR